MRTALLAGVATVAIAGASFSQAVAQTSLPTTVLPPATFQGVPSAPQPVQGANNSNNFAAALGTPGVAHPVPGSIVVRVNARVIFYAAVESSSLDVTPGTGPTNAGAAKVAPYTSLGFARVYFGADGMATNGLRYGGSIELRQNFAPVAGSSASSSSSNNTFSNTLYVRRAFTYVAGDQWGIVRMGQADGPLGIFDNGVTTFQNFDDGGWNGDVNGDIPGNAQPTFPFLSQTGAEYGSSKVVYLSPQVYGFEFGVSYTPNNASLQDGASNSNTTSLGNITNLTGCGAAATGCYALSSSSVGSDGARFTNMYVTGIRYQNIFGPVGVYGMAAYYGSGHVDYTGNTPGNQFNGQSVGDFGLVLSIAGITFGGHVTTGNYNGAGALQPKGGVKATAWLAGVQYAGGPLTIGGSFYNFQSQGSPSLVNISQRNENGLALGLTYSIAPGLSLFASYLYGTRYQGDYNFQTGTVGTAYNNVKSQAFGIGPLIRW